MTIREYFEAMIAAAADYDALQEVFEIEDMLYEAYEEDAPAWDEFFVDHDIDWESAHGYEDLEAWIWDMCGD